VSTSMSRRSFIEKAAATGGGLLASHVMFPFTAAAKSQRRPNILVIIVDEMRTPQWFPSQETIDTLLPNLARGAYEEAIHVPLYIYDPRGQLSNGAGARTQFTSTVDLAPMLLTIASGSSSWRSKARYSHIASRADIAQIAAEPTAAGRPWIAHITDETTVEELSYTYSFANEAPHHVAAVRTPAGKYAVYSTSAGARRHRAADLARSGG
jgi:arylsulfatase A-like enzyme